jgi:polyisoprenoid-binding protein YceI
MEELMKLANGLSRVLVRVALGLVVAASSLPLALPAFGQAPAAPQAAQPASPPRSGDVDVANSRAYIRVGATGLGHEHGVEGMLASGRVALGAAQNAGQLVFDMKSFKAETAAARKYVGLAGESDDSTRKQVTDNMLGSQVLDVAKFPQATYDIQSATPYSGAAAGSPPVYLLDGQFTLHGTTKHLRMLVQADEANGMIHLRGQFPLLQSTFGITPFTKLLGTVGVADQLLVYGDAWIWK